MLEVLILQSKDRWHIGIKSKTHLFVAYKKCISLTETNISLQWYDEKNFQAKHEGIAMSLSDKIDFKQKLVTGDKKKSIHIN
jgi:hypothetical protein